MDFKKEFIKLEAIVAIVTFLIVEVIGLCFGKVIEGSLGAEIAKWVVMGIFIACIMCGLAYSPIGIYLNRKRDGLDKKKK